MKSIPNKELNICLSYLSLMLKKDMSVMELKKLRDVREEVREKTNSYNDLKKSIWEAYGFPIDKTVTKNEENKEFFEKVTELDNEIVEISGLNFLEKDLVIACCPPTFNHNDIDKAIEYLAKK